MYGIFLFRELQQRILSKVTELPASSEASSRWSRTQFGSDMRWQNLRVWLECLWTIGELSVGYQQVCKAGLGVADARYLCAYRKNSLRLFPQCKFLWFIELIIIKQVSGKSLQLDNYPDTQSIRLYLISCILGLRIK